MTIFTEEKRDHLIALAESQSQDELNRIFGSLKKGDKVEIAMKAVMGHGGAETGKPTIYTVGRKGTSKKHGVISLHLLNADGSKPHPMRKVTIMQRQKPMYGHQDPSDFPQVSVAIGDMGTRLISLKKA